MTSPVGLTDTPSTEPAPSSPTAALDHLLLFVHLWVPAVTAHFMAVCLAAAYPNAVFFPEGAWCLYLGVFVVYVGDRLVERGRVPRYMHPPLWAATIAAVGSGLYLAWLHPARIVGVAVLLGLGSLVYGPIKNGPLTKTLAITVVWWVGITLLPFHLRGETALDLGSLATAPSIAFALMLASSSLLYDFKDVEADRRKGVRSLPVLLGPTRARLVTAATALAALVIASVSGAWLVALESLFMLALVPFPSLLGRRHVGPLAVDVLQILPGLIPLLEG